MTDIEDFQPPSFIPLSTTKGAIKKINSLKIKTNFNSKFSDEKSDNIHRQISNLSTVIGGIPGSQSIYLKTWGCSHNWSDSEYMAGLLTKAGYRVTFNEKERNECKIWILNSCTVKNRAQNLFETALKTAKKLNKYVISAGCVPSGDRNNKLWKNVSIIGVQQIASITYAVQQTIAGNVVQLLKDMKVDSNINSMKRKAGGAPLSMPKMRRNDLEEIIPINTGCLNNVLLYFCLHFNVNEK